MYRQSRNPFKNSTSPHIQSGDTRIPSGIKQTKSSEYRTRQEKSYGDIVNVGKTGKGTDKNYNRWAEEYLWSIKNQELLGDYKKSLDGRVLKGPQDRYNTVKDYMKTLSPEQTWSIYNYRKKRYYPNDYEAWLEANPEITTTIKEQRDRTETLGTPPQKSKGGFDEVWNNMPLEEQNKYVSKEEWITAAEEWNARQKPTEGSIDQGDWYETSRSTSGG